MQVILWIVLAVAVALAFVYFGALRARRLLPKLELPPGESLPQTPLQRMAKWTLGFSALLVALAAAIVVYHGPQVYWDDDRVRLTVMGLLMAVLATFSVLMVRTAKWIAGDAAQMDERDRAILAHAPAGQGGAILVTLGAWIIGLAETYHETHQVPIVFLYLMFWSCLMMSLLAWLAGIVLGYRRQ